MGVWAAAWTARVVASGGRPDVEESASSGVGAFFQASSAYGGDVYPTPPKKNATHSPKRW